MAKKFFQISRGIKAFRAYDFLNINTLFVVVLLVGLFIRLHFLTYPLILTDDADSSRDYLIARHIAIFHQFPLVGPWNNAFRAFINSPFYYYWAAVFLSIHDSIIFLSLANIFLQLGSAVLIYFLGKGMFGTRGGFWAACFFIFSQINIIQSRAFWQPYAMQPFLILGMFLIYKAYAKKNAVFLSASAAVLACAFALHNSVAAVLPILIVIIGYIWWINRARAIDAILIVLSGVCTFMLCYTSVILSLLRTGWRQTFLRTGQRMVVDGNFFNIFIRSARELSQFLFPYLQSNTSLVGLSYCVILLLLLLTLWALMYIATNKQKFYLGILAAMYISAPVIASVMRLRTENFYYTPSFPTGFLLLGALTGFLRGTRIMKYMQICCGVCFIILCGVTKWSSLGLIHSAELIKSPVQAIAKSIDTDLSGNTSNFTITTYEVRSDNPSRALPIHPALFLAPLEKIYKIPLVTLDSNPSYGLGYRPRYKGTSVFLVCRGVFINIEQASPCESEFYEAYPGFKKEKIIYNSYPFLIFLVDRT